MIFWVSLKVHNHTHLHISLHLLIRNILQSISFIPFGLKRISSSSVGLMLPLPSQCCPPCMVFTPLTRCSNFWQLSLPLNLVPLFLRLNVNYRRFNKARCLVLNCNFYLAFCKPTCYGWIANLGWRINHLHHQWPYSFV